MVLVVPEAPGAVATQALARVRGELQAARFEVETEVVPNNVDRRATVERALRDADARAAFGIFFGSGVAEIWVSDSLYRDGRWCRRCRSAPRRPSGARRCWQSRRSICSRRRWPRSGSPRRRRPPTPGPPPSRCHRIRRRANPAPAAAAGPASSSCRAVRAGRAVRRAGRGRSAYRHVAGDPAGASRPRVELSAGVGWIGRPAREQVGADADVSVFRPRSGGGWRRAASGRPPPATQASGSARVANAVGIARVGGTVVGRGPLQTTASLGAGVLASPSTGSRPGSVRPLGVGYSAVAGGGVGVAVAVAGFTRARRPRAVGHLDGGRVAGEEVGRARPAALLARRLGGGAVVRAAVAICADGSRPRPTPAVRAVTPDGWLHAATDPGFARLLATTSPANSDPWLVDHNQVITSMSPAVLVLNFDAAKSSADTLQYANNVAQALAVGSMYHGYSDPTAVQFLSYQIKNVIDLTTVQPPRSIATPPPTMRPHRALQRRHLPPVLRILGRSRRLPLALPAVRAGGDKRGLDPGRGRRARRRRARRSMPKGSRSTTTTARDPRRFPFVPRPQHEQSRRLLRRHRPGRAPRPVVDGGRRLRRRGAGLGDRRHVERAPRRGHDANAFLNLDFNTRFHVTFAGWSYICTDVLPASAIPARPSPPTAGPIDDFHTRPLPAGLRQLALPGKRNDEPRLRGLRRG